MIRTLISLEDDDKAWLDLKAAEEKVSRAELVRRAVRMYRKASEIETRPFHRLLTETSDIWKDEDGLAYQLRVRDEWSR